MKATTQGRHQLVRTTVASREDTPGEAAVALWGSFRARLSTRVGEGVFTTMFIRTLLAARATTPTLPQPGQPTLWFTELRTCLDRLPRAQATEVSSLLFITFTDILAVLLGEAMTLGLLLSAWGSAPASGAFTESKHE
ncbi:MAG: hypothetical protein Q8L14_12920 [Myxococcales bacterium]|nr:hypothetical protein [Myxococcales bacterium]